MTSIIKSSEYTEGTYSAKRPRIVHSEYLELHPDEARAVRRGRRGCSCESRQLNRLGQRCADIARTKGAKSWSIYPVPAMLVGLPRVYVEFHNWPGMGMCNFNTPVANKRYWWDEREQPKWLTGNVMGNPDVDGNFDPDA